MVHKIQMLDLIDEHLRDSGLRCIEIQHFNPILRIFVDFTQTQDTAVSIEDCVRATKILRELPELDTWFGTQYEMEVCSPGIERPVRRLADFQQYKGEFFKVKTIHKVGSSRIFNGALTKVNKPLQDSSKDFTIEVEVEPNQKVDLEIQNIKHAYCHLNIHQKTNQNK